MSDLLRKIKDLKLGILVEVFTLKLVQATGKLLFLV